MRKSEYLELGQVVVGEGPRVSHHGDVAVELSQSGLAHLGPVLTQILFPQVELPRGENKRPGNTKT